MVEATLDMGGGVSVMLTRPQNRKDIEAGDNADGYRMNFKINHGRRWKHWHLPVAVLKLDRSGSHIAKHTRRSTGKAK